ncbi:hypothetical protein DSAG12_02966 [Promethearchaeum syntrophicum]|uniref:Uncharacterized protein n=1 Tax=Promethearchaeum syntrophicum TaxID=2594042 RepID=A0A5B9DDD5_9ARCH|nr:hypothetical protein [Candidatus Prometheoarchaeum syntrophicum]QEE17134.1 hypothetical protein DSAG12_02966 [Candidatus Prometheoarchaeum syntrophicum]
MTPHDYQVKDLKAKMISIVTYVEILMKCTDKLNSLKSKISE